MACGRSTGVPMTLLILGLMAFIASHMIRVVADDWRSDVIARVGEKR